MSSSSSSTSATSTTAQPSSILFFIAIAIGIVIAFVFIFFSLRYYVRTKLGIYATARLTAGGPNGNIMVVHGDFPVQQLNLYNQDLHAHIRAQRRRRRYMKKRRLTEQEVDHLFPSRTYQDWLNGGAVRDAENRDIAAQLKQENDEEITEQHEQDAAIAAVTSNTNQGTTTATSSSASPHNNDTATISTSTLPVTTIDETVESKEVDLGNPYVQEIHYDSGSCAICIDTFEPEDIVRGLICGHVFHQECLDPWLTKRKACCPMCKRDYYLKNNVDDDNDDDNVNTNNQGDTAGAVDHDQGDADSFVGWPELQYTTLEDRVVEILQRNPELENIAREKIKPYMSFKWRLFWFIMGITKTDLLNCTIASEDENLRARQNGTTVETTTDGDTARDVPQEGDVADEPVVDTNPNTITPTSQDTRRENG
ncbi:hypothetical protein BON22_1609 [Cyberlindnera fabianii]|uniref:RING-type domain-containing protein n=1 Tax=Cyberlindnera fabianii TaxID=36022 RepID=A0A1V2L9J5_CYBFA|nr:hypothetical protein BON22_1609 [Cyberlindnera fabianii]